LFHQTGSSITSKDPFTNAGFAVLKKKWPAMSLRKASPADARKKNTE
jgi:hypothetical protein